MPRVLQAFHNGDNLCICRRLLSWLLQGFLLLLLQSLVWYRTNKPFLASDRAFGRIATPRVHQPDITLTASLLASCSAMALRKLAQGQVLPDECLWRLGPSATVVWQRQHASCSEGWIMTMLQNCKTNYLAESAEAGLQPQRQNKSFSPFVQSQNALPDLLLLLRMMAGRLSLAGLHLLITCQC